MQKKKKVDSLKGWDECSDFINIKNAVQNRINTNIPVLPLKFSMVFDAIFEEEKSIAQLMENSGLAAYQYKDVSQQFNAIYTLIDTYHAQ